VVRTRVGYTGGTKVNPTYYALGDHTETVQIDYDPAVISYEELLEVFWGAHNPAQHNYSRQYAHVLFYHDEEQERLARASAERVAESLGSEVQTELRPADTFYLAEAYHQKYYVRNSQALWPEVARSYAGDDAGLVASTVAARLNGYLGGYGSLAEFEAIADEMALSEEGLAQVRKLLGG